jgi:hypothetical protein
MGKNPRISPVPLPLPFLYSHPKIVISTEAVRAFANGEVEKSAYPP